jgi:two-component system, chemotaxis family, chemotaxis protein CheY
MKARVLIADDASFMRQMIREIIEPEGYEVVGEATNGIEAVKLYLELQPDLVTMDIVMPKCSGIEAVRSILAEAPQAQVVMCSALGQETLVMEALQAGAKNFIVKPFKPDAVLSTLDRLIEKKDVAGE